VRGATNQQGNGCRRSKGILGRMYISLRCMCTCTSMPVPCGVLVELLWYPCIGAMMRMLMRLQVFQFSNLSVSLAQKCELSALDTRDRQPSEPQKQVQNVGPFAYTLFPIDVSCLYRSGTNRLPLPGVPRHTLVGAPYQVSSSISKCIVRARYSAERATNVCKQAQRPPQINLKLIVVWSTPSGTTKSRRFRTRMVQGGGARVRLTAALSTCLPF